MGLLFLADELKCYYVFSLSLSLLVYCMKWDGFGNGFLLNPFRLVSIISGKDNFTL